MPTIKPDQKKVSHLLETFPFLVKDEAEMYLVEFGNSVQLASNSILASAEKWQKQKPKAKPKKEEPLVEDAVENFKPRPKRAPRQPRAEEAKKEVEPEQTKAAVVVQKAVTNAVYQKGGLSFADMLKKQKEAAVAPPPPPKPTHDLPPASEPVANTAVPRSKQAKNAKNGAPAEPVAETVKAAPPAKELPTPAKEAPAPAVVETPPAPAAQNGENQRPRPRRQRGEAESTTPQATQKKQDQPVPPAAVEASPARAAPAAPAATPAAPAPAASAPAPARAPAASAPAPAAAPAVIKYVVELDRVPEAVALPPHVQEQGIRYANQFTFSGEPGTPPPPPVAPVQQQAPQAQYRPPQSQSEYANAFVGGNYTRPWPWGDNQVGSQQQQQQQQQYAAQQSQQTQQQRYQWEQRAATAGEGYNAASQWARAPVQSRPPNSGSWNQYPHPNGSSYYNQNAQAAPQNYNRHIAPAAPHPGHGLQRHEDAAAYAAIREEPRPTQFQATATSPTPHGVW